MKIVQIISYYPPHLGGMENVAKEISECLAKRGHQVEVFTSDIGCKNVKLRSTKHLKIHYLKSWEFAHSPIIPSLFFKLLKISKDSIMHVHIAQALVPEVVYLVSKIKKIPYVVHIHIDIIPSGKLEFLLPLYKKVILKRVLKSASKIIVPGKEYRTLINKKYNILKNIMIIPNGVCEEFFINKENVSSKHTNLLFVGRLSVQKNIPKLIDSVSLIKSNVVLHIIGDGEKKKEIEKLISDKKLKNVILYGKKTGKDLINFYKNADIFILTSDIEAMPLVLLETMACKIPVIATDIVGVASEVIQYNCGIIVNPRDSQALVEAIIRLLKNPKLAKKMGENGRKLVESKYSWESISKQIDNIYQGVIS